MAKPPSKEVDSRTRKPAFKLIPSIHQAYTICGHALELARQARIYLTVEGQHRAVPELPEHLKTMGLTALTYTAHKLELLLSRDDRSDVVCSLDTMIALEWIHSIFYDLLERWGWTGEWEWSEQREAGVPYVLLPIRWTSRTIRADDLAALKKAVALLLSDPALALRPALPKAGIPPVREGGALPNRRAAALMSGAQSSPPPLIIGSPLEQPVVRGVVKPLLSNGQYNVVKALWSAQPDGLTLAELGERSGHATTAVKILRSLMSDEEWASVIIFPKGGRRGGYRLATD